jgi:GTPase SAR1 family protein
VFAISLCIIVASIALYGCICVKFVSFGRKQYLRGTPSFCCVQIAVVGVMLQFQHPFTCIVSGSTSSGKTSLVRRLIASREQMITPPVQHVLYAYGVWQSGHLAIQRMPGVQMHEGVPSEQMLRELAEKHGPTLLVMDDLLSQVKKDVLAHFFMKASHALSLSVVFIVQNLFYEGIRNARINAHYLILMRNPPDALQVRTISRQIMPSSSRTLVEAYEDATRHPYGYLLIDCHPSSEAEMRLLTHIFPDDRVPIVYTVKPGV